MYRIATEKLLKWKESKRRKPLIIEGARQVGKTWLMKEFGKLYYTDTVYINFDSNSRMAELFASDLDTERLIMGLELYSGRKIDPDHTLLIFDEVQEVPRALSSLKYFYENAPELAATVENSFKNSNYGDQFSGMVVKYTAEPDGKDENGRPVRGARTVVSIVLDDGTVVDIKDNTKTYRVAVNEYCATLPGSVFENKTPVQNVNEAPIDNISAIEALRAIGKANNGKLPLDLTERCVKVELVEEDPCEQYTDLDANAWYAESVHFALVNGLFVGFGDGTFRPEAALSRAMVATVLYRQAGSPAVTGTSTFPDLKDDWYADAVAWAQEAKVVIGDDKGLFRPDDDVTREEMVTMLYRFAASQNMDTTTTGDLSNFTDASSVQSYATEPMTWAVGNGIILGMGNNELAPRESATRAQFAAITARLAALK